MSNWPHKPAPVNSLMMAERVGLEALLMLDLFQRLKCGICGPNPLPGKAITDATRIDAGYALDAPEVMPAGGMTSFTFDDDLGPLPEELMVYREGGTV